MATELLRHQNSRAYYENNNSGCMWGLFNFLDFHRHLQRRKMLSYRRHGDGDHGRGQEHLLDKEAKFQMGKKVNAAKKNSGKTRMITFLYKKMTKKRDRKLKVSPSAAQLLRTISIHHLECDDYVLPDEITSDSESSTVELNSHETDFSASREQVTLSPMSSEGTIFSKSFTSSILENHLQALHASTDEMVLNKSVSFPGFRLSGKSKHKLKENDSLVNQEMKSKSGNSRAITNTTEDSLQDVVSMAGDNVDNGKTILNRLKDLRQKIKDVIKENRKEQHRISMDGVMDKVPIGHKLPEDVEKEKGNQGRDNPRSKFGSEGFVYTNSKFAHRSIQRSLSLTESQDRYSHLFKSISVKEPKRLPERLKSIKEEDTMIANRRILRSHSLIESFDRYSRLLDSVSIKGPKRFPERLKSVREDEGFQNRKSSKLFGRILSNPEILSYSFSNDAQSEEYHATLSSKRPDSGISAGDVAVDTYSSDDPESVGILVNTEECMETDTFVQHNGESNSSGTIRALEHPELINEHDQSDPCAVSDDQIPDESSYIPQHEDENEIKEDPSDKPTKPSPVSVLDSYFEEFPVSPAKYAVTQGCAELQSSRIHFEEQDSVVNPENHLVDGDSEGVELIKVESDEGKMTRGTGDTISHVQMDLREDAEFNYVKEILWKSGFGGGAEEFLGTTYSPYQPVDQLPFMGGEGSPHELETIRDDSFELSLNHQLLFDLINDALLEIYENSTTSSSRLTRFYPCIRPKPVGDHVLEEVWKKVSWHLNSRHSMNNTLDHVVARDFAKNDGWMNLQLDMETVGIQLEGLILDNLLDEIILDFGDV